MIENESIIKYEHHICSIRHFSLADICRIILLQKIIADYSIFKENNIKIIHNMNNNNL